jgi:hypothetical protein
MTVTKVTLAEEHFPGMAFGFSSGHGYDPKRNVCQQLSHLMAEGH